VDVTGIVGVKLEVAIDLEQPKRLRGGWRSVKRELST